MARAAAAVGRVAEEVENRMGSIVGERTRLEAVLEAMDDAVIALDNEGRITLLNGSAQRLIGVHGHRHEVVGRRLADVADAPELTSLLATLRTDSHASVEFETARPTPRAFLARGTRQTDGNGSVLVVQDVTRLRRLEKTRKDFVANVSHELRTPVTVIRANAETLLDGAINEPKLAATFLDALLRNADRLSALVADLLDLSRIESGTLEFAIEPIGAFAAAQDAVASVASEALAQGSVDLRRGRQGPVDPVGSAEKRRADLVGAEGDHGVHARPIDRLEALGALARDVDPQLGEDLNGLGTHAGRRGAGRRDRHTGARERTGQPLRHLAAGRVRDAEQQEVARRAGGQGQRLDAPGECGTTFVGHVPSGRSQGAPFTIHQPPAAFVNGAAGGASR